MKVVVVDDEELILDDICAQLDGLDYLEIVGIYTNPFSALEFIEAEAIDCVLLDIEMPGINGIEFASRVNSLNKGVSIIFITGYDQYALEAFHELALGYLVKPVKKEKLHLLLEKAYTLKKANKKEVFIQTFGRFDLFVNDQVVLFKNAKAKELLAVCVDQNGGTVDMDFISCKLWPDRPYDDKVKGLYRKAIFNLKETLASNQIEDLFCNTRGLCYVNRLNFSCDYFSFLEGKDRHLYKGEYMTNYDWSDETNYELANMVGETIEEYDDIER